jgi:branched-chain amino acid transport system substrate-binding protein
VRVRWLAVFGLLLGVSAFGVSACGSDNNGGGGGSKKISGTKLTIYSSVPLQGSAEGQGKAITNGARLALEQRNGKVGKYTVTLKPLDDAIASTGAADEGKGAQNARTAVSDKTSVGYIGEYNSGISKVTIPLNNKGGLMQVSPANTYVGLTTNKVPGFAPGEPDKYYPTHKRTYARIVPIDTVQAAALASTAKADGCKTIHIYNSKTVYSAGLAKNIVSVAPKVGLKVEGSDAYDPNAANYRQLTSGVKADCIIQTGEIEQNAVQVMKDAIASDPNAKLYGGDAVCLNASADPEKGIPLALAPRYKCTVATLSLTVFGSPGAKFGADYRKRYHAQPDTYAIYGYEAMQLLLDSLDKAAKAGDVSREAVVKQVFRTKNRKSVLGTYSINQYGDTSLKNYGLYKIVGKTLTFDKLLKANPKLIPAS